MIRLLRDERKNKILLFVFYFCCIVGLYVRNCFGIDIEDEPYHVASVFHVLQGGIPLMSIWDGHTGFFLMAPFGILYKWLVPALDGVVLYFREIGLTISLIISAFNIRLIGKKYNDKNAWMLLLPVCLLSPTLKLSYNSASSLLLCTVCCLLYTEDSAKNYKLRYFVTGILAGLACLNYPTFSLIAIFLAIYIFFRSRDSFRLTKTIFYALGVAVVGALFFAWIFSQGSILEFLAAINAVLHAPHTAFRGPINLYFLYRTFVVGGGKFFARSYSLIIIAYFVSLWIINRSAKEPKRELYTVCAFAVFCVASILPNRTGYGYAIFGIALGFAAMMFTVDKSFICKHGIFYAVIVQFVLIYSFTSDNKNVMLGVSACSRIIAFTIVLTLYERAIEYIRHEPDHSRHITHTKVYALLMILLSLVGMAHSYGSISGDSSIFRLNTRVSAGVFSGQWTTEEKADYLDCMETFVDETVNTIPKIETRKFAVVTLEPMAYLMTNARIYTPWTFDSEYLFKGFYSAKPIMDYYKQYGEYPQILFATNKHNQDFYENSKYEVNNLIHEKYHLIESRELNEDVTAWVWVLNGK